MGDLCKYKYMSVTDSTNNATHGACPAGGLTAGAAGGWLAGAGDAGDTLAPLAGGAGAAAVADAGAGAGAAAGIIHLHEIKLIRSKTLTPYRKQYTSYLGSLEWVLCRCMR